MLSEIQSQKRSFEVRSWHVIGAAAILVFGLAETTRDILYPHGNLICDVAVIAVGGMLLGVFTRKYRAQKP